jgi:hypothetical protein
MSDTASSRSDPAARRWLIPLWFAFAGVNFALMFRFPGSETVPFHFIWLSLALVYGLTRWRVSAMVLTLAVVGVATFVARLPLAPPDPPPARTPPPDGVVVAAGS